METVSFELIDEILDHINRIEKQNALLESRRNWDKITSALQVLEDSSCAVSYYLETQYPSGVGGKYLFTYGLLQALFIQEDAANSISEVLIGRGVNFKEDYPEAYMIREIRNDVVGHPTNRGNNSSIFLVQVSLSKQSFCYFKNNSDAENQEERSVDVGKAISNVAECVNAVLKRVIELLDTEFKEYIEKHRERKMTAIFNSLSYAKEKALSPHDIFSNCGYETTKKMVQKCEEELILRYGSIEAVESYHYVLGEIHELYSLIDIGVPEMPDNLRKQVSKFLMQCLFSKLECLRSLCKETDFYFESYGQDFPEDEE